MLRTQQSYQALAKPFEYTYCPERGSTYWDWTLAPILNADGSVDLLALTLVDVTARIIAEEEVARDRIKAALDLQMFSCLFRMGPVLTSIRSAVDGRYIDVNDAWLAGTGYEYNDVIGKTCDEIELAMDQHTHGLTHQMLKTGIGIRNEPIQFKTKTGEKRAGLCSAAIISCNDEPCILTMTQDITADRAMQEDMQRLERLNLIGQMAAGLGHEIRNPMTSVRGFLQLLSSKYLESKYQFDLMISELDRANAIITDFLELSKTQPELLMTANINEAVAHVFPMLRARAFSCDKEITLSLSRVPDTLLSEREMRQVLLNLTNNALDATPQNSTVFIRTKVSNNEILIEVEDKGPGIDPKVMPMLGTPFLTTKDHGTGLGLAITYNIVKLHAGRVEAKSSSSGTTFTVHLPIRS